MDDAARDRSARALMPAERQERIAERLRASGGVTVAALQAEFGVSPMTARRDLAVLERLGRARRTHGGAVAPRVTPKEESFRARLEKAHAGKQRLAAAACACVEDGEAVFADSSTTAYFAVRALLDARRRFTMITNSVPLMALLAEQELPRVGLIGVGGLLRQSTSSFVGPQAVEVIGRHFADKLLFSVSGIAADGLLTEADGLEAEVKRAMLRRAREAVLLVEGTKLGHAGLAVIGGCELVSKVLVADAAPGQLRALERTGIPVERVG
jgi:DeoR/GlpR family transcriptional regulator of sugar metabolism